MSVRSYRIAILMGLSVMAAPNNAGAAPTPEESALATKLFNQGRELMAAWGSALPVDGGLHFVEASAPGRKTWSTTIDVASENDKQVLSVPKLELVAAAPSVAPPLAVNVPGPSKPDRASPPTDSEPSGGTQRVLGFAVGGLGVIGIGAGTYFGLRAFQKRDQSEALCHGGCSTRGADLSREAATSALPPYRHLTMTSDG